MRTALTALGIAVLLIADIPAAAPAYAQYYGRDGYYGGGNRYDQRDGYYGGGNRYDRPQGYGRPYRRGLVCVTQYRSCAAGPSFQFPGQYCECRLYNYGPTVPGVTQ